MQNKPFELPYELRGKKIKSEKIIPTVCNLKTVIKKLTENGGEFGLLKQWACWYGELSRCNISSWKG